VRRAEKQALKAGLVHHLEAEVRKHTRVLEHMRWTRKRHQAGGHGARSYYNLIKAQIIVLRRTRLALEAGEAWNQLRMECMVISAPARNGEGRRINDNDPRWSSVTDDSIVMWDNNDDEPPEETRWGDLLLTDRKTVEMGADGVLRGGYPF
jgi:hypothetical protein